MVLDRCTRLDPDFAKDSEDFTVFFSYDLIDDFRDPGKSESSGDNHANDDDDDDDSTDFGDEASRSRVSKWIFPEDGGFSTEWGPEGFDRTNHPLNLMVSHTTYCTQEARLGIIWMGNIDYNATSQSL